MGVARRVEELGFTPLAMFVKHFHFNHVAGLRGFTRRIRDARVYAPRREKLDLLDPNTALGVLLVRGVQTLELRGGEVVELGPFKVLAVRAGGHTRHHTCYLVNDAVLVTGDLAAVRGGEIITRSREVGEMLKRRLAAILPGHGEWLIRQPLSLKA